LNTVWERRKQETSERVEPGGELMMEEAEFPVTQPLLWDYVTRPDLRRIVFGADSQHVTGQFEGRTKPGAVYHCVHGSAQVTQIIVDWQPFEQYTTRDTVGLFGMTALTTFRLSPGASGTRLSMSCGAVTAPWLFRPLGRMMVKRAYTAAARQGIARLKEKINADLASGVLPNGAGAGSGTS
jgi:hypothetical protein